MWLYIPGDLYLRRQQNGRQLRVNLSCQKRRTLPPSARIHNRIFYKLETKGKNKRKKEKTGGKKDRERNR